MALDLFNISQQKSVNVVELFLPTTLDVNDFDRLNDTLLAKIRGTPEARWLLDLSHSTYMGSAALGLLVNVRQQVKQSGGRLMLCGLSESLTTIFHTCCMERLFKIARDRDEALAHAAW